MKGACFSWGRRPPRAVGSDVAVRFVGPAPCGHHFRFLCILDVLTPQFTSLTLAAARDAPLCQVQVGRGCPVGVLARPLLHMDGSLKAEMKMEERKQSGLLAAHAASRRTPHVGPERGTNGQGDRGL